MFDVDFNVEFCVLIGTNQATATTMLLGVVVDQEKQKQIETNNLFSQTFEAIKFWRQLMFQEPQSFPIKFRNVQNVAFPATIMFQDMFSPNIYLFQQKVRPEVVQV